MEAAVGIGGQTTGVTSKKIEKVETDVGRQETSRLLGGAGGARPTTTTATSCVERQFRLQIVERV
jgi:hypothetical protein